MAQTNSTSAAPPSSRFGGQQARSARVIPLRLRTEPPAAIAPPDGSEARAFIRIQVTYDVAAVAQVIAPILDYDVEVLTRALRVGPLVDGPHSHADAVGLVATLAHFGAVCELERVQSLGGMPDVDDPERENSAGRYVYGTARRSAGQTPTNAEVGVTR